MPIIRSTTECIQKLTLIILLLIILFRLQSNQGDSHLKRIISTSSVYIWLYLLMMGLDTPETCRG